MGFSPYLSVVIPVCNESGNLGRLYDRLYPVLRGMGKPFEIIFVDNGSRDDSLTILKKLAVLHPETGIMEFSADFGHQMAILAAFERVRGQIVLTMDADPRNPLEEIPRLLAEIERGRDMVGVVSQRRDDSYFRGLVSHFLGTATLRMTGVRMSDYGGMPRAYGRDLINSINRCGETTPSVPALARSLCSNTLDIRVPAFERGSGAVPPPLRNLARISFDLMVNFSLAPLRLITACGAVTSVLSLILALVLLVRCLIVFTEVELLLILFAILSFLVGLMLTGIGIVGEYTGRIYREVRKRPRFVIRRTYGFGEK